MVSPINACASSLKTLAVIGFLQTPTHSCKRRPEVVGQIVAHLLYLAHQCFDAIQHQIEVFSNAIPFVMGAAERDALCPDHSP